MEILRLCGEAGLVKLGKVSLDGTKVKANASLLANRKLYKIRGKTVEPVFGQIKAVLGFDSFMRRGIEACQSE